jgi:hypothetical protein
MTTTCWRSGAWPVAVSLTLLLAACGGAGGEPTSAGGAVDTPPSPGVAVAFAAALPEGVFDPTVEADIASTPALWVVADWTGVSQEQSERLVLTSPGGTLYYAQEIPFADTDTSLVHVAALSDGTRRVVFKFLIWGTEIETFAEAGTWIATATLVDDAATGSGNVVLR